MNKNDPTPFWVDRLASQIDDLRDGLAEIPPLRAELTEFKSDVHDLKTILQNPQNPEMGLQLQVAALNVKVERHEWWFRIVAGALIVSVIEGAIALGLVIFKTGLMGGVGNP